jgi:hypothetical protein
VTRATAAFLAAAAVCLATAAGASASPLQESILMDDAQIVYAPTDQLDKHLAEVKALGFDRVRVSVYWNLLAPSPNQKQKPTGNSYPPSDPRFYAQGKWDRYDRIVALANKNGLGVLFTLTGPSPLWATGTPEQGRSDVEDTWQPSAGDFKDFATAVGTRYSGTYRDEHQQTGALPILPPETVQGPLLPRVDHWSIWNEPNHGGWLTPQWLQGPDGKRLIPASPRFYRPLVDAAWSALQSTGHSADTILLGETAPAGLRDIGLTRGIRPLRFIRELYCIGNDGKPYTGAAAGARSCPPSFDAPSFAAAHPGLFAASGWAHHPYSLTTAPSAADQNRDNVTLSGVSRLADTLDGIFATYGQSAKLPIWLTEYGYQTNPPDPTLGVPWARQADWLDDATFRAYLNPRIVSMAQFLLVDDGPLTQFKPDDPRYWGTFQTGLVTAQGKLKPAYESAKRPIDVLPRRARPGGRLRVFGQLRTAAAGSHPVAEIQFKGGGAKSWSAVATATANDRGFVATTVKARRPGSWRIVWAGGAASREVAVRVAR